MLNASDLTNMFNRLNKDYFGNQLPAVGGSVFRGFEFTKRKTYLGQFHWDGRYANCGTCLIRISYFYQLSDFRVECVLIHEMVHMWQWVNGLKNGHGYDFKRKAREINNKTCNKYAIARCTSLSDEERNSATGVRQKHLKREMVMTYNKNGKKYIAKLAPGRLDEILSWFPKHSGISNVQFGYACSDLFTGYKQSRRTVHGYTYDANVEDALYGWTPTKYVA